MYSNLNEFILFV